MIMDEKILLGELREFKRIMTAEVKEIKRDVKSLMKFHWRLMGAAGLAAFLSTTIIEILRH